jgi:hypothetical protein
MQEKRRITRIREEERRRKRVEEDKKKHIQGRMRSQ